MIRVTPDGEIAVSSVQDNIRRVYDIFINKFSVNIPFETFEMSYEYVSAYLVAQYNFEEETIAAQMMIEVMASIAEINESVKRPAVLHSRVSPRFKEIGFDATIRVNEKNQAGLVAICVDDNEATKFLNWYVDQSGAEWLGYIREKIGLISDRHWGNTGYPGNANDDFVEYLRCTIWDIVDVSSNIVQLGSVNGNKWNNSESVTLLLNEIEVTLPWMPSKQHYEAVSEEFTAFCSNNRDKTHQIYIVTDTAKGTDVKETIGRIIGDEMFPAGAAFDGGNNSYHYVLSNNQTMEVIWDSAQYKDIAFHVTLVPGSASQYPENTEEEIATMFLANFVDVMSVGSQMAPETYLTMCRDVPWAASILVKYTYGKNVYDPGSSETAIINPLYNIKFKPFLSPLDVVIEDNTP